MKSLILALSLVLTGVPAAANAQPPPSQGTSLTLLGVAGGPGGKADHAGIASLVTAGGAHYLIDAGEGVSRQLAAAHLNERDVGVVLLTHLHDDHTVGLAGLMSFFYTLGGERMELVGPPGTAALGRGALGFLETNADIRSVENHKSRKLSDIFKFREAQPGVIYSDERITVTAVENTHYRLSADRFGQTERSYALKVRTPDKVIVFTGDTGDSAAVAALAEDADILVSEMISPSALAHVPSELRDHMLEEHLSPLQVGELAQRARVKMLVLSHILAVSDDDLAQIRLHYSGPLVVGQDLDRF